MRRAQVSNAPISEARADVRSRSGGAAMIPGLLHARSIAARLGIADLLADWHAHRRNWLNHQGACASLWFSARWRINACEQRLDILCSPRSGAAA
jgi:hypothetical protein